MLVGIHKDPYDRFCNFLQKYEAILSYNRINHVRLDASQREFWETVSKLDLFIFRWKQFDDYAQMAKSIIPIVENQMGIKCFPNMTTCWHFDDKIRQYYLLRQRGFPVVETWVFWDRNKALEWVQTAEFPAVFKLKGGAGSKNVVLAANKNQARKITKRIFGKGIMSGHIPHFGNTKYKEFDLYKKIHHWGGNVLRKLRHEDMSADRQRHKNYVLFQRFLPNNNFDTRVTVIGDRAFAFLRYNRNHDFRASGSGKIDYDRSKIDMRCLDIAFAVSADLNFQSMSYDFLFDEKKEPKIAEISYTFVDTAIYNCPGFFDRKSKWHEGHFWPQYFHLVDALDSPGLKQPQLDL